ncbi:NADH dehydrogenase subunit N [Archaeoglobus sulfaticallidus PM70-1]|uniref:NADH dehydrogenase subunit N n=1 Tax=Archaeoglobus sulfaticallidus PM70-1 TaxID=387631 RepID=N0BFB7_9EURY|nr:proton-conducting transporter membrane subunit [Archaeoglobus sulfaticallidus]AGK61718.1 NADH dehydrogenase subunit N [Archaeoglobus sulfaticallidus PM70-1]
MEALIVSIILLTLGAIFSLKDSRIGFIASILALVAAMLTLSPDVYFYGVLIFAIAILNLITLYITKNQIKGVDYALSAIMAVATLLVIMTNDFATLMATFVLVSVPTYVLVMLGDEPKVDLGIKYITFMVLATILFIIGAFITVYSYQSNPALYVLGYVMLILGLALEVGVAPLHEWVPDVFASADPIPISIIASIAKFVPFIVAFKILISTANPALETITMFSALLAVVSMFVGNIGALTSKEHGRVLGYSTVANMGYVLATFVAIVNLNYIYLAISGALLQLMANSAGKIGFFTAIKKNEVGSPVTFALAFSFVGMPPFMGFWSKLFIVLSIVNTGYLWLAILLVINSAISVPYYFRLARELGRGWGSGIANLVGILTVLITLITIYPPDWFVQSVKVIVSSFNIAM